VIEVVSHDGCGFVEKLGDFGFGEGFEGFGEEIGVITTASLDEDLLYGGALWYCVSLGARPRHRQP
jgi:hypothetical protein